MAPPWAAYLAVPKGMYWEYLSACVIFWASRIRIAHMSNMAIIDNFLIAIYFFGS
jgi:hypothetical protein